MPRTAGVWRAILWFALESAGFIAVVVAFSFRSPLPVIVPALPALPATPWFPVMVAAPGTNGRRTLRPVSPKLVRQGLENIPAKDLGHIIYNPPDHMTVGRQQLIEAAITLGDVQEAIRQFISKARPTVEPLNGKVASRMRVKLLGDDFKITELNTEEQQIDTDKPSFEPTLWRWNVIPLQPGPLVLTLRATRVMSIPKDGEVPRDLPSFETKIIVTADYWYSVSHWAADKQAWLIPLAVSLAVPVCRNLLGRLWKRKRRRTSRNSARFRRYRS